MKSGIALFCCVLALTACATNRIPEKLRTDLHFGEATYFQQRCPRYKQVNVQGAAIVYCLANKAYNNGCSADKAARDFMNGSLDGYQKAKTQYGNVDDKKLCEIAERKYGKNGYLFKNFLK